MNSVVRKIEGDLNFEKKFTFCTLVTRFDEYLEMVESANQAGFVGDDIEFLYFDNKNSNQFDGYSGINRAIKEAKGQYLIFCHQDILFKFDRRQDLEARLQELEQLDPIWAVVGNAGKTAHGEVSVRISDPHGMNKKLGKFPQVVMSIDENFIVVNQQRNLGSTVCLSGFHIYGVDLCQNARNLGLNSYVIDFHLLHKSAGKVDQSYFTAQKGYIDILQFRKKSQFIWIMCSGFFVSDSKLKNWLLSRRWLLAMIKSYYKKR